MFDGSKEKSVVIKVYVEGDESNAQSTEILSTSKMNTYTMTFTGGTADSKIVLMSTASSGKRGLISIISLYIAVKFYLRWLLNKLLAMFGL